ncbi:peptidase family M1-domain-containing protein, partial [Jimgerdemannia flammicorona]
MPTTWSKALLFVALPLYFAFLANYFYRNYLPTPATDMTSNPDRKVLPSNVKPLHYDLTLTPNLETFKFDGTVKINLAVKHDTEKITLHAQDLEFGYAKVHSTSLKTETAQLATEIKYDEKTLSATLSFPETIPHGSEATLEIGFKGTLNDKMFGFYRSSYQDAQGNTKYLATTQFEATHARRAFPCWDEPALKATFDVTLVVPSELVALSNMNIVSEKPVKDSGTEVGKTEVGKTEVGKTEVGKTEVGKTEVGKTEVGKTEVV